MSSAGLRRWLEASRYSEGVAPLMTNPYIELTNQFNHGRRRALVSSGQAVVLHRLAIMSKDGDWILREDQDSIDRVLEVLAARGARYRFGAPLDLRWLAGGWSSHFEFVRDGLRLRTDFRHATAAVVGITTESAVARRRRRRAVKSLWRCR